MMALIGLNDRSKFSLRDAEDRAFGKIEQLIDRSRPFVPAGQHLCRGVNQLAAASALSRMILLW